MKKLFFAVFTFAIVAMANAQTGFELGVHVKPQSVWIMNKDVFDAGDEIDHVATFGVDFGLDANYMFLNNIGVATGLSFSSQGQKYKGVILGNSYTSFQKMSYMKIPLKFRYVANTDANSTFYLEAGPQFSFLSKASLDGTDVKQYHNSSATDIVVGFGTKIRATDALGIVLGLEVDYSLTNIDKNPPAGSASSNNLTGGLKLGVLYHFGNK